MKSNLKDFQLFTTKLIISSQSTLAKSNVLGTSNLNTTFFIGKINRTLLILVARLDKWTLCQGQQIMVEILSKKLNRNAGIAATPRKKIFRLLIAALAL